MSGVLHPVGPESSAIYWLRRGVVLAVLALVVVVALALTVGRNGGGGSVAAVPAASPLGQPSAAGGTGSVAPSSAKSSSDLSASPASRTTSTTPPAARTKRAGKTPARLPVCSAAVLRTRLAGKEELAPQQATTFTLSLVNSARRSCVVTVTAKTFALTISSGADRIWSTRDCSSAVKATTTTVASGKAVTWKVRWNGLRSAPNCRNGSGVPRAGTYVATARLAKAEPVRMAMVLVKGKS